MCCLESKKLQEITTGMSRVYEKEARVSATPRLDGNSRNVYYACMSFLPVTQLNNHTLSFFLRHPVYCNQEILNWIHFE